jgi:hypothetical protein
MKVRNMINNNGNHVPNQFIVYDHSTGDEYFQSYAAVIVKRTGRQVLLDEKYWDYSTTTGRYRNKYLGDSGIAETRKKIADGTYKLTDLNNRR